MSATLLQKAASRRTRMFSRFSGGALTVIATLGMVGCGGGTPTPEPTGGSSESTPVADAGGANAGAGTPAPNPSTDMSNLMQSNTPVDDPAATAPGDPSQMFAQAGTPGDPAAGPEIPGTGLAGPAGPGSGIPGADIAGPEIPGAGLAGPDGPGAGVPGADIAGPGIPGAGLAGPDGPGAGIPGADIAGPGIPGAGLAGPGGPGADIAGAGLPGAGAGLPGAEGGIPGAGGPGAGPEGAGGGGQQSQVPSAGTPEHPAYQLVMGLMSGKTDGLAEHVGARTTGTLASIRSGKLSAKELTELKETFARPQLIGTKRISGGTQINLRSGTQIINLTVKKEGDAFKVTDMKIRASSTRR